MAGPCDSIINRNYKIENLDLLLSAVMGNNMTRKQQITRCIEHHYNVILSINNLIKLAMAVTPPTQDKG